MNPPCLLYLVSIDILWWLRMKVASSHHCLEWVISDGEWEIDPAALSDRFPTGEDNFCRVDFMSSAHGWF